MKFKIFEKLKFRLSGRNVPVVKVADVQADGQIRTLQMLGELKDRPNSLVNTWDEKGWEKTHGTSMITLINENGTKSIAHIVSESGRTIDLYTYPRVRSPNYEDVLGKLATADDIADNMDLGKSKKNIMIGILIGMALWAAVVGPVLQAFLS